MPANGRWDLIRRLKVNQYGLPLLGCKQARAYSRKLTSSYTSHMSSWFSAELTTV